ncbi:MAG: hypothetical protein GVY22_03970, partial [Gammaproteobacteria bacterium]|nr:hypothetical protein [Gammaproteobacteria bacterium]
MSLFAPAQPVGAEQSSAGSPTAPSVSAPVTVSRVETEHLVARLIAESAAVVPGGNVELALVFDLRPGWHTYWRNPGDSGEPPK